MKILLLFLSSSFLYSMEPNNDMTVIVPTEERLERLLIQLNYPLIQDEVKKITEENGNQFDNAAIQILLLAQRKIGNDASETKCFRTIFDKIFEEFCDTNDIFQAQRISIFASNIANFSEWMIRGYVANHCFEKSLQPKENREKRMKVVLRYPSDFKKYEELGLGIGKDNNYFTILHPNIHSTIVK